MERRQAASRVSRDGGAGDMPLVLVPGVLCDARVFTPLLDRLGDRPTRMAALAGADVAALAARVLATAPPRFALLGFSLGGIVALEIAAQAPERVLGLALIGSNGRAVPPGDHAARRAEAADGAAALTEHLHERLWPSYVAAANRHDEALRHAIAAMAADGGPAALLAQTELSLTRADSLSRAAALTMPVLVLAGAEDARCPPEMQRELAERLRDATLALVPGAGHFVLLEAPDATAAHVAAWLARVEAAAALPRDTISHGAAHAPVRQAELHPAEETP